MLSPGPQVLIFKLHPVPQPIMDMESAEIEQHDRLTIPPSLSQKACPFNPRTKTARNGQNDDSKDARRLTLPRVQWAYLILISCNPCKIR